MANQIANGLQRAGITNGDKVALSCPNLPYFPLVYYGILKAGAVVVPINVLLKGREIAYHLKDSKIDIQAIAETLRVGISGASSLPLEIIKRIEEKYRIPIMEGYGLSGSGYSCLGYVYQAG